MRVIILNYGYPPDCATSGELLERYHALGGWAEAVAAHAQVTVLQRFHGDARFELRGVAYQFMDDGYGPLVQGWQIPLAMHRQAKEMADQAVARDIPVLAHLHGLLFPLQTRALRRVLPGHCALALQHHAEGVGRVWRRPLQRWGLSPADGFLFSMLDYAQPWVSSGIIQSDRVFPVVVGSTAFVHQDREQARAVTGMQGDPVFLWVGRLNDNKDPLTVLAGLEQLLSRWPQARLYMAYGTDELLPEVKRRVADSELLGHAVTLMGRVPHADLQAIYNSADYFVLGSHYEGLGFALAEAMACGVVPIVTDIPSYRMMTDDGRIGALWSTGQPRSFCNAVTAVLQRPLDQQSSQAQGFFRDHLSWPAIGRRAYQVYCELLQSRQSR